MTYAALIGHPWGMDAVMRLERGGDNWTMLFHDGSAKSPAVSLDFLLKDRPRYVFLLNWSQRVPRLIHQNLEVVNFHCTPLPYGRGGAPIENMILRGHETTVITAHKVVDEIDAGPIYMQSDTVSLQGQKLDILSRFVEPVSDMMRRIMASAPRPTPQAGPPVQFRRLSNTDMEQLWRSRKS